MADESDIGWIKAGVAGGLIAGVLYPTLLFVPLPAVTVVAAAFLGPGIGVGSLGLRKLIHVHQYSVAASLAAIANVAAGTLFTAMAMVQLAVRMIDPAADPLDQRLIAVWLGLDVAWDVYIGLGTLLFAWSMLGHPRFGPAFAITGLIFGSLVIVLNLFPFPTPPAEAGLIDIGPAVGLWYVAATIQAWRSLGWARSEIYKTAA